MSLAIYIVDFAHHMHMLVRKNITVFNSFSLPLIFLVANSRILNIMQSFSILVMVKYLLEYGQLGAVHATSTSLLWNPEKAGQAQELSQDH